MALHLEWLTEFCQVIHEGDKDFEPYEDDDKAARIILDIEDIIDKDGKLLDQQPVYDTIINAEV